MPFGRHKGKPLSALPDAYLEWLLTIDLREPLAGAVRRELARREAGNSDLDPTIAGELLLAGYRVLAMRHHPDRGGDTRTMQQVNATVKALRQLTASRNEG